MFKALMLQRWFNLSDPLLEEHLKDPPATDADRWLSGPK